MRLWRAPRAPGSSPRRRRKRPRVCCWGVGALGHSALSNLNQLTVGALGLKVHLGGFKGFRPFDYSYPWAQKGVVSLGLRRSKGRTGLRTCPLLTTVVIVATFIRKHSSFLVLFSTVPKSTVIHGPSTLMKWCFAHANN